MPNRSDDQKGPQHHAEGQHGNKTHKAFLKELKGDEAAIGDAASGETDVDAYGQPRPGRHRLDEDRQQHDEAEKNSENNKLR